MSCKYMYLYARLYERKPLRGLAGRRPPEGLSRPGAGPGRAALGVPAATNWQLRLLFSADSAARTSLALLIVPGGIRLPGLAEAPVQCASPSKENALQRAGTCTCLLAGCCSSPRATRLKRPRPRRSPHQQNFLRSAPRVPDVGKMPNEYRYMPTSIRPILSDPSCVRDSHLHRRSSIARTCLYMLQTCMYRLHTHPAAYGIGTSMPLLGLLASCASIFPANGRVPL